MGRKALLIGCNYPGTSAELKGCINDVMRMHRCLLTRYGFSAEDITVMIDTDDSYTPPTGKNIRHALSRLVRSAEPGDFLFVHYSGHGLRLPAESGDDDDTGFDECIVPCDMNVITDDDFRDFVDDIPPNCRITMVSDSCHSGGLIDESKEQIGDSTKRQDKEASRYMEKTGGFRGFLHHTVQDAFSSRGIHIQSALGHYADKVTGERENSEEGYVKNRSLPLSTLIDILKQKTGKDDIDVGKLRPALFDIFGEDASPKVKKFMKMLMDNVRHGSGGGGLMGLVGSLAQEFLKQKLDENGDGYAKPAMETKIGNKREAYAGAQRKELPDGGILISGCQTNETSADASSADGSGQAYGALSNVIQRVITESEGSITNQQLVVRAREMLQRQGFSQRPGLYCSDCHVHAPFVCPS